jgi:hypothetical protein
MVFRNSTSQTTGERMKSAYPIYCRNACFAIDLVCALTLYFTISQSVVAAIPPAAGLESKVWPANPAKHQVVIDREAANKQESALIAAAEAIQPSAEVLRLAFSARDRDDPLGLAKPKEAKPPVGEKIWWYKEQFGIRIPCAITADAVAYYSDLVGKYRKQALQRPVEPSSRLEYHARIKFHKEFELEGKSFADVHVVTLHMIFEQNFVATTTEGMHFNKKRVVIFDDQGKLLHISGDGATEVPVLAI